jgi:hypothetical protein
VGGRVGARHRRGGVPVVKLAVIGLVLVAAHAVAFVVWVPGCRRPELTLEVPRDLVGGDGGVLPEDIEHARVTTSGSRPGLHYKRYTVDYRGGFERSVGVASLVGPFQDPARAQCSGRIVVGQRLLDDGNAGPGTIAGEMAKNIAAELAGEEIAGAGEFKRVEKTTLQWAELVKHLEDMPLVAAAPFGYVRATTTLVFDNLSIPLVVALIPEPALGALRFRIAAHAQVKFDNRVLDWLSDKLGGDKLATRFARREIDNALVTTLAPPPPFDIPGGGKLTFGYCEGVPEIVDGVSGALPFAVAIGTVAAAPKILPPRRGPAPHVPLGNGTLAIDLDLDGANALLHELWRSGLLDQQLASAGLDRRFNTDPLVTELLTLQISTPVLALPPLLATSGDKLQMFADARLTIRDGTEQTVGRVWGGLDFKLAPAAAEAVAVDLGALELSCERSPTTLVPCYADLVAAMRDRGSDFHGELTRVFAGLLDDIFVDQRVGASGLSADLVIRGVTVSTITADSNGSLHLELAAALVAKK